MPTKTAPPPSAISMRSLIIQNLVSTGLLLFVGTMITDGGRTGLILLVSCAVFWVCALGPIRRHAKKPGDVLFLKYGIYFALGITFTTAWVVEQLR